jgi:hypothetical protein
VLAGEGIGTWCLHANVPAPLDVIAVSGGADELVVDFRTQCKWPRLLGSLRMEYRKARGATETPRFMVLMCEFCGCHVNYRAQREPRPRRYWPLNPRGSGVVNENTRANGSLTSL